MMGLKQINYKRSSGWKFKVDSLGEIEEARKWVVFKGQEIITGINKSYWSARCNINMVIARLTSPTSAALASVSAVRPPSEWQLLELEGK
jgi:hypothetical protein